MFNKKRRIFFHKRVLKCKYFNEVEINKITKKFMFQNIIDLHAKSNTIQDNWDKFEEIYNKFKQNMLSSEKVKALKSECM
jgi:hypothetical protein